MGSGKKHDGIKVLSRVSGIPRESVNVIWEQVKTNHAKLKGCRRHQFGNIKRVNGIGKSAVCLNCGGEMRFGDLLHYGRGYAAAGGDVSDVYTVVDKEDFI